MTGAQLPITNTTQLENAMIHVRIYSGSLNGTITDMTNAGKRGKTCRVLTFLGVGTESIIDGFCFEGTAEERLRRGVGGGAYALACRPVNEVREMSFEEAAALVRQLAEPTTTLLDCEIRGVDAPRVKLTAGIEGKWSASADESGVAIHDLADVNEWTEITGSRQSPAKAYDLARKVWDRVKAAATRHEASTILHDAGCRLHGFCGLD